MIDGFYLPPALARGVETAVQRFGPAHDAIEIRLPLFQSQDVTRWIEALRRARAEHLAARPIAAILRPLERVVARYLDRRERGRRALVQALVESGRFPEPMIERALDDAFEPLARGGLRRWIAAELGSLSALDQPVPTREGVLRRAVGPEWMLQVYAGNIPAVPVWPMLGALLLKSALLAKTSAQEPVLAPMLARAIAQEDETLGRCLAVVWWKGGTEELERAALAEAPAVLAFGGEIATASLARMCRPDAKTVFHGPKVSVAYLGRGALSRANAPSAARRLAEDAALYDQQGCLSPHAIYVERGGAVTPVDFAAALGEALEEALGYAPPKRSSASQAASLQLYRAQARFDAATDPGTSVHASAGTRWTVVCESGARFEPGPAHRTLRIHSIGGPDDFERAAVPSARFIEAVALEEAEPRRSALAARFAALGIPRVTGVGSLQRPSPLGTHGGVPRLLPFVTWSTVEPAGRRVRRAPKRIRRSAGGPSARGSRTRGRAPRRSR
ncbi:MAG: acyl-CoA reductase [Bacteroidota bacterium]